MNRKGSVSVTAIVTLVIIVAVGFVVIYGGNLLGQDQNERIGNLPDFDETDLGDDVVGREAFGYDVQSNTLSFWRGDSWTLIEDDKIIVSGKRIDASDYRSEFSDLYFGSGSRESKSVDLGDGVTIGLIDDSLVTPENYNSATRTPANSRIGDVEVNVFVAGEGLVGIYLVGFDGGLRSAAFEGTGSAFFTQVVRSKEGRIKQEAIEFRDSVFERPISLSYVEVETATTIPGEFCVMKEGRILWVDIAMPIVGGSCER